MAVKEIVFWSQHTRWPNIKLMVGDITKLHVDALVTGVKSDLVLGGDVNSAIHRAAGFKLASSIAQIGSCDLGQAIITQGFDLPAKYVIHTVCPVYNQSGSSNELLASCYVSSLNLATQYQVQSIAFPSLATGMFGFPHEVAANIAARTIRNYIFEQGQIIIPTKDIIFTIFHEDNYEVYAKKFSEIFI